ncbi:MAG: hypothetical protein KDD44_04405, partial [Bdellovibrionales bacterium]|nr:hypothetical protein [Bdellovibrionales bacterium]
MGGLLKHLQKPKTTGLSMDELLTKPQYTADSSDGASDAEARQAEDLLAELVSESKRPAKAPGGTGANKVILAGRTGKAPAKSAKKKAEERLPWWLTDGKKT